MPTLIHQRLPLANLFRCGVRWIRSFFASFESPHNLRGAHIFFWEHNPSLLLSLTLAIVIQDTLFTPLPYLTFLWSLYLLFLKKTPLLLLLPPMFFFSLSHLPTPPPKHTRGILSLSSIQHIHSPFHSTYLCRDSLLHSTGRISCTMTQHHPPSSDRLWVEGELNPTSPFHTQLTSTYCSLLPSRFPLAIWRYQLREQFVTLLKQLFPHDSRLSPFFLAITTGEVQDRLLRYRFQKLGLEHILGVSSLHFTILASFCTIGLLSAFPPFLRRLFLSLLATAYFLFVGSTPAVQRCWLMTLIYLIGKEVDPDAHPSNLLGLAMLIELIASPSSLTNIGFQLSFTSCLAISLLSPIIEWILCIWWPKRSLEQLSPLPLSALHLLFVAAWLRKSLSLTLAVALTIFPLLLSHTNSFPLISLFYNLFFPWFADLSLFLLSFSLLLHFALPLLAPPMFALTASVTSFLLDLCATPPPCFDLQLLLSFPSSLLPLYNFLLFCFALPKMRLIRYNYSSFWRS